MREAKRAAAGEIGRVVIGYPSSLAFSGLTELLRAFRARRPGVQILLREMPPQEQLVALADERIDVGFVRGPLEPAPGLRAERVRREALVAALPAGHRLASRRSIALADLAPEPFISFPRERGPQFFDQLMRLCADAGFSPRIVQEAPQLDILSFVAAGFGVAIVPASLRGVRRSGLVLRDIAGAPSSELYVAWREPAPIVVGDLLDVVRRARPFGRRRER